MVAEFILSDLSDNQLFSLSQTCTPHMCVSKYNTERLQKQNPSCFERSSIQLSPVSQEINACFQRMRCVAFPLHRDMGTGSDVVMCASLGQIWYSHKAFSKDKQTQLSHYDWARIHTWSSQYPTVSMCSNGVCRYIRKNYIYNYVVFANKNCRGHGDKSKCLVLYISTLPKISQFPHELQD